jgi:cytochrome d ubiquinol oxidase subunit II
MPPATPNTLRWLLIVTLLAVLLVGPALALLYRLDLTDRLTADHDQDLVQAPRIPHS